MYIKSLLALFLSILFGTYGMEVFASDVSKLDEIYSGGSPSSSQTSTYVFLCTKVKPENRRGAGEGGFTKCCNDCCGAGCCDDCTKEGKAGLFLGAITVDESLGELTGLSESTRGLIWSATACFRRVPTCSSSSESVISFRSAYNLVRYASVKMQDSCHFASEPYQTGYRDVFYRFDDYKWLLEDNKSEYLHYHDNKRVLHDLVSSSVDYTNGGVQCILESALFRWKLKDALSIDGFLKLLGGTGKINSKTGYLMAPRTGGFLGLGLWARGYTCVELCESFLNKSGLVDERNGWFLGHGRADLLQHILVSDPKESMCVVARDSKQFAIDPASSCEDLLFISGSDPRVKHLRVEKERLIFSHSDFKERS